MKVIDFDDREYNWPPAGHEVKLDDRRQRSSLHLRVRSLLKDLYPTQLDFFLPMRNVCIEVNGEQHYKFISHFHGDKLGFMRAKTNDKRKREWCQLNNLRVVELPFKESDNEWRDKILHGGN